MKSMIKGICTGALCLLAAMSAEAGSKSKVTVNSCCYWQPDLEVVGLRTSTSKPKTGVPFYIYVDVRNKGTYTCDFNNPDSSFYVAEVDLYLNQPHCVAPYDSSLADAYYFPSGVLQPGQILTITYTATYHGRGRYTLRAFADSYNAHFECVEANNQSTRPISIK
jgi:hypothetical protein